MTHLPSDPLWSFLVWGLIGGLLLIVASSFWADLRRWWRSKP